MNTPVTIRKCRGFNKIIATSVFFAVVVTGYGQKIATHDVPLPSTIVGIRIVARIGLTAVTFLPDSSLTLLAVDGIKRRAVPCKSSRENRRALYWMISGNNAGKK